MMRLFLNEVASCSTWSSKPQVNPEVILPILRLRKYSTMANLIPFPLHSYRTNLQSHDLDCLSGGPDVLQTHWKSNSPILGCYALQPCSLRAAIFGYFFSAWPEGHIGFTKPTSNNQHSRHSSDQSRCNGCSMFADLFFGKHHLWHRQM
jgi:hypothetical protein